MPQWDADVYLRFAKERTQPSVDLVRRINLDRPARVIDLGCGPGNSTVVLRDRWPDAMTKITGLDNSDEMIQAARKAHPEIEWITASAAEWKADEPFDLVFSNAMLHWLPDHANLCRHWLQQLTPGGALAVQLPAHYDSPLHQEILAVSSDPAWDARMEAARTALTREPASFYYDALYAAAAHIDLWETTYYHVVDGPEAVLEWFRGSGLRPFLERLESADEKQRFEGMLLKRYEKSYPRRASGKVLFPFRRIFFVAYSLCR